MLDALHFTVHRGTSAGSSRFTALPPPDVRAIAAPRLPLARLRRILVATDGTRASEGAVIVTGHLARRHRSIVDVVSVLPRWGPPAPNDDFLDITGELLEERLGRVIPQSERALRGRAGLWTVRVIDGTSVVDSIADAAQAEGHDLIVVGGRRNWFDRWFRSPTALGVARASGIPVLAVPSSVSALPRVALAAIDDGDAAGSIAPPLARVLAEDAVVEPVLVHGGEPVERLAAQAKVIGADLIAFRLRGSGVLADRIRRSVGRRLLRATDCSVLLLPPPSRALEQGRVRHA